MPTERNRGDLPREYENYREQQQRIQRAQDRIAVTRDDEEIYRLQEDARQQSPFVQQASIYALIGSTAALAARKAKGSQRALEIFGNLGNMADRVRQRVLQGSLTTTAQYLRYASKNDQVVLNALLRRNTTDVPQIKHLEIVDAVQDLNKVFETVRDPRNIKHSDDTLGWLVEENKKRITQRFAAGSSSVGDIQKLTVGDIMSMGEARIQEMFGESNIKALKYGVEKGFLSNELSVGSGLYLHRGKDKVLHVPTVRGIGQAAHTLANQFNIPFTPIKFGDVIAAPIKHIFGRGDYAGVVANPYGPGRAIGIGGALYKEGTREVIAEEGIKIARAGVMGDAVAARHGRLAVQTERTATAAKLADPAFRAAHPYRSLAMAASELTGIGTQYRDQNFILKSLFWDAPKRQLFGVPHMKPSVSRETLGFHDRLRDQALKEINRDPITGKRLEIADTIIDYKPQVTNAKEWAALNFKDKLKAIFGSEEKAIFMQRDAKDVLGRPINKRLVNKAPAGGSQHYDSRRVFPGEEHIDELGKTKTTAPLNQFAYAQRGSLYDVGHYMTNRLNALIGATTGIGYRPTRGNITGVLGNLAKIYGIYGAGKYGLESLKYADYFLSVNGYAPSDAMLDLYKGARTSLQHAREMMGVSPVGRYLEDLAPGSVEGFLPTGVRTVAPAMVGLAKKSVKGTFLGVAAGAFLGPGLTETPEETQAILSGEQLVPIRKGRYWWLGKQPFEGGKIDYFAPGIVARLKGDAKYTNTLYGNEAEYFRNVSPLPTPTNLFGFLSDPEYLTNKHKFDRPYPEANMQEYSMGHRFQGNTRALYGAYGPPEGTGATLGYGHLQPVLKGQQTLSQGRLADRLNQITELSGIYKFALWDMTGLSDLRSKPQVMADSNFMQSDARAFNDAQLGGMFGMTELYRRFVTSDEVNAQRHAINPLPNQMPEWLPGSRSSFAGKSGMGGDDMYHIDFSRGDPYAKIKMGELRLPGEARERMHRLHSGSPGVYDAVDRFLVLADVAPHSDAFRHYKAIVEGWRKSGVLDDYWTGKIEGAKEQVKQKMERYQVHYRRFTGLALPFKMTEPESYSMLEKSVGGAWETLTHDIIPRIGISIPLLGPMLSNKLMAQRDPLEQYLKTEIYDTDEYDWARPWETILRPTFEQLKATDPITATVGGGLTGFIYGANPMAKLILAAAGGSYFGAQSTARAATTGQLTGGYVPDYVESRRELQEYFDYLSYVKYARLEGQAKQLALPHMADYYSDMKERTVASLDYSLGAAEFNRAAMKALPTRERGFYMDFLNSNPENRENILQYLPEYLKPVYQAAWAKQGDASFSYKDLQVTPDQRVAEYFSKRGLPDSNWAGWHPEVNMRHVMVRTSQDAAEDIHRMNLFQSDVEHANYQFGNANLSVFNVFKERAGLRQDITQIWRSELLLNGVSDVRIDQDLGGGLENSITWDMKQDRLTSFLGLAEDILRS